ncbi:MAG: glycosyltransferase [Candidatus Competibacter sp.]|nr:glycosyltransferase [Candidatus Competibacter sp.]MDG4585506.1 glycosyltransferase [Candidatus Competibacter sp.]
MAAGRRTARPSARILLLGKRGSLVLWLENLYRACARLEHPTQVFAINGNTPLSSLWAKWQEHTAGGSEWMLARFERALARFRPELVLVAGVFGVPLDYYRLLYAQARRPVIAGLVGDRFPAADSRARADRCDRLYYTDTRFFKDAKAAGFTTGGRYLPLAADPELFHPAHAARQPEVLFVASRTAFRETVVRGLEAPARIVGTDWSDLAREDFHRVRNRKIGRARLVRLYQRHVAVLNARNEANVEHGLNQRSFEPPACGAVVLNDDLVDLPRCFEPGREILVYRNADELNALIARLRREPEFADRVAAAGRRRVLAEHTYAHRITAILNDLGF